MASLSSIFSEYESDRYDNFSALPDWYIDNYDVLFKGKVREVKINAESTFFLSSARNQLYMMFYWYPTKIDDPIKVTFEVSLPEGEKLDTVKEKLRVWLKKAGYKDVSDDGKVQKLAVNADNIQDVVELWSQFWS